MFERLQTSLWYRMIYCHIFLVYARMGHRSRYRVIETPRSSTNHPIDVARGLLSIYPFRTIYAAGLDAIERIGHNNVALSQLKNELPDLTFLVDNGVADWASAQPWLETDLGNLVLGSETQEDGTRLRALSGDDQVILSLDYRGDAFVGPEALANDATVWPKRVIAMTLARVGSVMGPDWKQDFGDQAPQRRKASVRRGRSARRG